jgi:F0F1-type ATP synthase epsilon subunit
MNVELLFINKKSLEFSNVSCVTATTQSGVISIYPDHQNIQTLLDDGSVEIEFENNNNSEVLSVNEGIISVLKNRVLIFIEESSMSLNLNDRI